MSTAYNYYYTSDIFCQNTSVTKKRVDYMVQ